jgi:methylated-DNA-protein-cysteine methyltransferase-like protein
MVAGEHKLSRSQRQVGMALKHLPNNPSLRLHEGNVPWQRVINSQGRISPRYRHHFLRLDLSDISSGVNGARRQANALQREGVEVGNGPMGEYTVSLREYGWFPSELPSAADSAEDSESSDAGAGEDGSAT